MKRGKTIFLIIYLVFHLLLLVSAIVVNLRSEDFEFLFSVRDQMGTMVWFAIIGLVLFIINVIIMSVSNNHHKKKEEELRQEINSLKAKIYDLQDAKSSVTPTQPTTPVKPVEKKPSGSDDKTEK
ncbi:MAG: hypothetical protein ACNS60_19385 [Candidatus Cyclobacteriaceae bacterium M2_1C_046]